MAQEWAYRFESSHRPSLGPHYKLCPVCGRYLVGIRTHMEVDHPEWVRAVRRRATRARPILPPKTSRATSTSTLATPAALAAERVRATALAKRYGGHSELLTLAEASALHPNLTITRADLKDTKKFHIRFRRCSICHRFPARALIHLALHESGLLDAKGHRTDAEGRAAIEARVAKRREAPAASRAQAEPPASKRGRDWSASENRVLIRAYLGLLFAEMHGRRRRKIDTLRRLANQLDGRTRGSIEFKMENVSAVLFEEGLPWIDGYKPASNFQQALRPTVLAALRDPRTGRNRLEAAQEATPKVKPAASRTSDFEEKPPPARRRQRRASPRHPVARFWKGAERDAASRRLGRAGEKWVYENERGELTAIGRPDLAKRVEWVANTQGDGLGYDVLSFDADGSEVWIEVKTTNSGKSAPFLLTPRELAVWRDELKRYRLFRVRSFSGDRHLYKLKGDPDRLITLTARLWEARLA